MFDKRIKRKNVQSDNEEMGDMYSSFKENNTMQNNTKNGFPNNNMNSNMNNGFQNNNMNGNMNNDTQNNNVNNANNNSIINGFQEKQYKTGSLEENTVVASTAKVSKLLLFGFYLLFIGIGVVVFFMLRADKYEFYLKTDEISIATGSDYQVELIPKDARYFDYLNYNYSIGNESIATVDEFGKVTAVGTGTTTLKISLSPGFTSKVMTIHSENIDINSINLKVYKDGKMEQSNNVTLYADQSITLKATINDRDDLNTTVKYSSNNPNVASVDEFGNVTANSEGTAIISGVKNDITGTFTVTVKKKSSSGGSSTNPSDPTPVPTAKTIQSIAFASTSRNITLKNGNKVQLSLVVTPKELSSSTFTWNSENPSVASVDGNGVVTGVSEGTTTITVTSDNGKTATSKITITNEDIKISKISLNTKNATMNVGDSFQLTATIAPSNATIRTVNWSSNNTGVASIDKNGVVKAKSAGTAIITISTADGSVKETCTITVKKTSTTPTAKPTTAPAPTGGLSNVKVTKVKMDIGQTEKYVNESLQLSITVEPSNATNYKVTWSSSNTSVAEVSSSGLVKTKKAGTAVITASVDGVKGTSTIIVRNKQSATPTTKPTSGGNAPAGTQISATQVQLGKTTLTVEKGKTATFTITAKKAAGTVGVSSSDSSIASVSLPVGDPDMPTCNQSNGMCFLDGLTGSGDEITITVKGVKAGTTYINVSLSDIQTISGGVLTGSGKVGILVK